VVRREGVKSRKKDLFHKVFGELCDDRLRGWGREKKRRHHLSGFPELDDSLLDVFLQLRPWALTNRGSSVCC
jgi:hypothetical protein